LQSASAGLEVLLKTGLSIHASPRVIIDWNHNRYTAIQEIDNWQYPEQDNGNDLDLFPIESIVLPLRPTACLAKARAGEGAATSGYGDAPDEVRYYTASVDSKYKYWSSPSDSTTTTIPIQRPPL